MSKTLLEREQNHPQTVVDERDGRSIVIMDSARWVDPRNTEKDVVVPASYIGVLPARMVAIHRPRGVIGHDACVGKDGAGIAGLWYLEALGIPAATADGMSAEMGNGADLYENGVISHLNYPAERCGVQVGMSVREAAALLRDVEPTDVEVSNKIRREIVEGGARSSPIRSSGPYPRMRASACSSPPGTPAAAARASCSRPIPGASSATTAACRRTARA